MAEPAETRNMAVNLMQCALDLLDGIDEQAAAAHLQHALDIVSATPGPGFGDSAIPAGIPFGRNSGKLPDK